MTFSLLGIQVDPCSLDELLELIKIKIDSKQRLIVASQNLHSVYLSRKDKGLRQFQKKAIKRIDGMPIVYMGKLLGYPLKKEQRITWVDLMHPLMKYAAGNGWRVFYLGADEQTVSKGVKILQQQYPGLAIAYRNGFFDVTPRGQDNAAVVKQINDWQPQLLIVGMGMPRQEKWILQNLDGLTVDVIMTCGAAIEYVAGSVKTPPRWMGRSGLEWAFRLTENPGRFWYRYVIEPWFVLVFFMKDMCKKYLLRRSL